MRIPEGDLQDPSAPRFRECDDLQLRDLYRKIRILPKYLFHQRLHIKAAIVLYPEPHHRLIVLHGVFQPRFDSRYAGGILNGLDLLQRSSVGGMHMNLIITDDFRIVIGHVIHRKGSQRVTPGHLIDGAGQILRQITGVGLRPDHALLYRILHQTKDGIFEAQISADRQDTGIRFHLIGFIMRFHCHIVPTAKGAASSEHPHHQHHGQKSFHHDSSYSLFLE